MKKNKKKEKKQWQNQHFIKERKESSLFQLSTHENTIASQIQSLSSSKKKLNRRNTQKFIGKVIIGNGEKYRIEEKIGIGGYAVAYKVYSLKHKKFYVIKKINLEFLSERDYELALDEAAKMQKLRSDFIISLKSFFEIDSCFYIVMDFADGGDLQQLIEKQKNKDTREYLDEELIWRYLYQISQALNYCHAGGVIHRDLTPSNILIHQGQLKLTDFGISKQMKQTTRICTFTKTWSINYQSPERIQNKEYGTKADIWSLGCIVYQLCSLEHPFAEDQLNTAQNIIKGVYKPIPSVYGEELKNVIKNMLNIDPSERPNAENILENAESILEKTTLVKK